MLHFSFIGSSISFASVSNVMLSLLEPNASTNHQGIEVGVASFNTITTQRLFDSYSHNFEFCRFEGPPRDTTMIPLNWKFELHGHVEFLVLLCQQPKKKVTY